MKILLNDNDMSRSNSIETDIKKINWKKSSSYDIHYPNHVKRTHKIMPRIFIKQLVPL